MARAAASRGVPGVDPLEEAIISKRYLTLTVSSVPSSLPPFKKLAKQ